MADVLVPDADTSASQPPAQLLPKFKLTDLPLTREQRSTIDALLNTFKKKGGYDSLRKQVWADYNASEAKNELTTAVTAAAEKKLDDDPDLLSKERSKAATLVEGAVDRSGVYRDVEVEMDRLISSHLDHVLQSVREVRRLDVGEDKAAEEARVGSKTDEDYSNMTAEKKANRDAVRAQLAKDEEDIAKLKAKIHEAERRKREKEEIAEREARKKKEEEEQRAWDAERTERRKRREEQRKIEEARERERYEKRKAEERERHYERDRRSPHGLSRYDDRRRELRASSSKPEFEEKDIEAVALERLLNEGKALAEKAKQRPEFDFEKAEARDGYARRPYISRVRDQERDRSTRHHQNRSTSRERSRRDSHDDRSRHGRSHSRDRQSSRYDKLTREDGEIRRSDIEEKTRPTRQFLSHDKTGDTASIVEIADDKSAPKEDLKSSHRNEDRSRSPRRDHGDDTWRSSHVPREPGRSRIVRSATPPFNIDRYVPGGGIHRDPRDRERKRERDREERERERDKYREKERDKDRYRERERDREFEERRRHGDKDKDCDRSRDYDRYRERDRERRSDRDREEERERERHRDRGRDYDRDYDRGHHDRDKERGSERKRERRSRSPRRREDRSTRDRERSEDRVERRRTFVEIDRYVPK